MFTWLGYYCIRKGISLPKHEQLQKYAELLYLRKLLERLKIDVVLDVGANKGWYGEQLRSIGFEGVIISFEPIPEDCKIIEAKSARDDKGIVINKAVGDVRETKKLNIIEHGEQTVMSSLLKSVDIESSKDIDVEIMRLDELDLASVSGLKAPRCFLKTDTQGFDMHVWRGTSNMREQIQGLQMEISVLPLYVDEPHFTDAVNTLEKDGMKIVSMNLVGRNRKGYVVQFDCLMCRSGSLD